VIEGVIGIFTYGFDFVIQQFQTRNIPFFTLSDYSYLLQALTKQQTIQPQVMDTLQAWRKQPDKWQ
jgi:orotate phosphoribosyltransferase